MIKVKSSPNLARQLILGGVLLLATAGFAILASSTVGSFTVQYDEFTDLNIASSLNQSPFVGSSRDGSQARLPMYATAIVMRMIWAFCPDVELLEFLPISRSISIFMVVLSILGLFFLGARLIDATTGLIAAAVFAISPFTLQFGRDALTQGDAFTAAMVTLTVLAFVRFETSRTNRSITRDIVKCCGSPAQGRRQLVG